IYGKVWSREDVASFLDLAEDVLPLFAIFCGCDYAEGIGSRVSFLKDMRGSFRQKSKTILALLRKFKSSVEAVDELAFDKDLQNFILEAIQKYNGTGFEPRHSVHTPGFLDSAVASGQASHKLVEFSEFNVFWCQTHEKG
ncbi:hypothetical protein HDU67_001501, partial [Dinochytrium kinnereticum]